MLKWIVFAVLWIASLALADWLAWSGSSGAFLGAMLFCGCLGVKSFIEGYQVARARQALAELADSDRAP